MNIRFPKPQILDSVSSTNDFLKAFIDEGLPRAVVARQQTRGKGRHGRNWVSERDHGLYVSYLCFPQIRASQAARLNHVAALAVALTLEDICPAPARLLIKPPNDVLLNQRKTAGILLETASLRERMSWAILGIGINLTQRTFPFEAEPPPTSLALEGIEAPLRDELCDILTRNLSQLLHEAERGAWRQIEKEFQQRIWSSQES